MHTLDELGQLFSERFSVNHFPDEPHGLYEPNNYFLSIGGKRIRPLLVLMANELFGDIHEDSWKVATALELMHNFTLIHDDIMDDAPVRRGKATVHELYGASTAILAGDVMLIRAYQYLNQIDISYLRVINEIFNLTSTEICEGQQYDMAFEERSDVSLDEYFKMISLKTSVLLAASLKMGSIIGGASVRNQEHLYQFGLNLGIAFQIQDDYLDCFGDPEKFGKMIGGDIKKNKKTFLAIHLQNVADNTEKQELLQLQSATEQLKVERTLAIMRNNGVDKWAWNLKQEYFNKAMYHLEEIAVIATRKEELKYLAEFLISREH